MKRYDISTRTYLAIIAISVGITIAVYGTVGYLTWLAIKALWKYLA